jgi:hypothetical protein
MEIHSPNLFFSWVKPFSQLLHQTAPTPHQSSSTLELGSGEGSTEIMVVPSSLTSDLRTELCGQN